MDISFLQLLCLFWASKILKFQLFHLQQTSVYNQSSTQDVFSRPKKSLQCLVKDKKKE